MENRPGNKAIIAISLITIAISAIVLSGWVIFAPAPLQIIPGFQLMKFNTAGCFLLLGIALLITQFQYKKQYNLFFILLSTSVVMIGILTLLEYITNFDSGLDQLFIRDNTPLSAMFPYPGRMPLNVCIAFILMGIGLLVFSIRNALFNKISQYLFHAVTILSATALIGYLYGVSLFYSVLYVSSMSALAALLFLISSVSASLLNPEIGFTRLFTGHLVGNLMARRLFTLIIFMVLIFGSLRVQTQHFQLFALEIGVSMLAVSFLLVSLIIIWNTANWLNKFDIQRSETEAQIKLMNTDLERRVEERTAEFQKSEDKYRSLIEHASDAIYVIDLEGKFLDVNASMCKVIGYSRAELMQLNINQLIDPEELKKDPLKPFPKNSDEPVIRERRFMKKDGVIFDAEINVKKFPDNRILVIARDITGRKKMEMELREAELKFRTIAERSMVGIYIVQKGKFSYVNPRFAAVFGYEPLELIDTFPVEVIIEDSYKAIATENVRKRIEGVTESIYYEAKGRKKDGSTNWVEFYGSRALFGGRPTIIGTMIDITERKNAEEILKRSEANLQTILRTTDTAYALFDKELKVEAFNATAIQFVRDQYNHEPQKGDDLANYFPKERFPQFGQYAKSVLEGNNINYEIDYSQTDGSVLWYYVRLFPIVNDNKEILGLMMALYNITERKYAEENLKIAYQDIQNHVDSIKEMAWKQSHLVRSPLANLKGLIAILKENPADDLIINHIETELNRLDNIIIEMGKDVPDNDNYKIS